MINPNKNGNDRDNFLNASTRSSIALQEASVEEKLGRGSHVGKFDCFCHSIRVSFGNIQSVVLLVIWGRDKVPALHYILGEGASFTWPLKMKTLVPGGASGVRLKSKALLRKASDNR